MNSHNKQNLTNDPTNDTPEQDARRKRQKRNTIILILAVLLASAISWVAYGFTTGAFREKKDTKIAHIWLDGEDYGDYPLDTDVDFEIKSKRGHNHFVIRNGKAAIIEADCPDKICIHQGWISESGETISCLPNQLVITIL